MAVAAASARHAFAPAPRALFGAGSRGGGADATGAAAALMASGESAGGAAGGASVPTDLSYGMRIGIRSCSEQRYLAVFPRSPAPDFKDGMDVEVSGFHPFRPGTETADRLSDCPSEWLILQYNSRQYRGPVYVGDDVCFVKELPEIAGTARRKERYAYLALGPAAEGSTMEPIVEKLDSGQPSDLCKWTLLHADEPDSSGKESKLQANTPLMIRGKYQENLAVGRPLWETPAVAGFSSPARASGRSLVCRSGSESRDSRVPELRFRLVRAGVPFGLDPAPTATLPPSRAMGAGVGFADFGSLSVEDQEQTLLEDALYCLLGVEGAYIRRIEQIEQSPERPRNAMRDRPDRPPALPEVRFEIEAPPRTDLSIVQFLQQVLPLGSHHAAVQHFVEVHGQYEYGTVNHALCAAIRDLLKEFTVKVGQLENALHEGNLTIAKLWYHIQPSMDTLALLHRVTTRVFHRMGGLVLNGIEEVMARSSLTTAQDLCEFLMQQASRPYFEMVSKWVYEGRLDDPYGEFFISENPRARDERVGGPAADFWQKHFVLEERSVPQFLSTSSEKILHAGKYLHVFFSASPDAQLPEPSRRGFLRYSRRRRECIEAVDAAYRRASAALLGLFMRPRPAGLDLPGRLKSMRSFFFLKNADWFGQLMDTATAELEQNAADVPLSRLEGLLDLAFRTSSVAADSYRDDISCGMHSFRIEDATHKMTRGRSLPSEDVEDESASIGASTMGPPETPSGASSAVATPTHSAVAGAGEQSGVRCFTLKYRTCWPLSIVFSKALMLKYQVIFRHLLYCRYIERKLVEVWVDHQNTKELGLDTSFSPSYSLRQRMLHFCRDYIYYATVEVLEPQSHSFLVSLEQAETVDDVLRSHEKFLDTCLRELLLTEREGLYRHLSKVLQTCLSFAQNLKRMNDGVILPELNELSQQPDHIESANIPHLQRYERVQQISHAYMSNLFTKHYVSMISRFKNIFESQLQGFLKQIRQESSQRYEHFLSNMYTRLDYNEYYSTVLTAAAAEADTARMG